MNTLSKFRKYGFIAIVCATAVLTACDDDDDDNPTPTTPVVIPPVENEEEVITDVKLIFTNENDTNDVEMATAQDPDGDGPLELQLVDSVINLDGNKTYILTYEIQNALNPNDIEDIAEEIKEEDHEHQIFYGFTASTFSNPTGDGNIGDNSTGNVNYLDQDENGLPVGLETRWGTGLIPRTGTFRTRLMHQPDLKDANSKWDTGEDDFDLTFKININ